MVVFLTWKKTILCLWYVNGFCCELALNTVWAICFSIVMFTTVNVREKNSAVLVYAYTLAENCR